MNQLLVLLALFIKSYAVGLLAVLTPFIYAVFPITMGILTPRSMTNEMKVRGKAYYIISLMGTFTVLGVIVALVAQLTGIHKFTGHWLFNFALFRLFVGLGLVFVGALDIKIPKFLTDPTSSRARAGSFRGTFFMALTLPIVSFSSLAPMLVIALLFTSNTGFVGPVLSLFAFSAGLSTPVVAPRMLNIFRSNKVFLNQVKVLLGFISILIGIKFFSYADISLGWNILDRNLFIIILMILSFIVALYLLGVMKFPNDYAQAQNLYGEEYVSMLALFVSIALLAFVIYLAPGLYGAPLSGINRLLPS